MPAALRLQLRQSVDKIAAGPQGKIDDPTEGPDFNRGMQAGVQLMHNWRHSWVEHELRQILAWADGAESAHDIQTYSAGLDYDK